MRNWPAIRELTLKVVAKEEDGPIVVSAWLGMGREDRARLRQAEMAEEIGLIQDRNPSAGSKMYVSTEEGRNMTALWRDEGRWNRVVDQAGEHLPDYDLHRLKEALTREKEHEEIQWESNRWEGPEGQERRALLAQITEDEEYVLGTEDSPGTRKLHRQVRWLEAEGYVYKGSSWNLTQEVWHRTSKGTAALLARSEPTAKPKNIAELKEAMAGLDWFTSEEIGEICRAVEMRNDPDTEDPVGPEARTLMKKTLERAGTGVDMVHSLQRAVAAIRQVVTWVGELWKFAAGG